TLAEIGRDNLRRHSELDAEYERRMDRSEADLQRARDEWQDAINQARRQRTSSDSDAGPEGLSSADDIIARASQALSENVDIMTKVGDELSGFVLSRHPENGNLLAPIPNENISFEHVQEHGSAIVMRNPQYRLHKTLDAVRR